MSQRNPFSTKHVSAIHPYQSVINSFDDYEIHGVRYVGRGKSRYEEQVPDTQAQLWSLYGHAPGEGLQWIADFKDREFAEAIYARITGYFYSQRVSNQGARS